AEPRRRARIEWNASGASGWDREGQHVTPMCADRGLHPARQGDAVLAHEILDLERLPAVWIDEGDVRVRDDEGRVDGLVIGCDVRVRLVGPVRHAVVEDGLCDSGTPR